ALTGNVSYDPENHQRMCETRREKVMRIQAEAGELTTNGPGEGELLLVGWGSTYGAITKAVNLMRERGYTRVAHVHLRWLNPLHPELGSLLEKYDKVVVPEMNLGQLVKIIRSDYLVDAEPLTKIQGKPFKVSEICDVIQKYAHPHDGK